MAEPIPTLPGSTDGFPTGFRILVADDRSSFCASVCCRLTSLGVKVDEHTVTPQCLSGMPPPIRPYDVLIVRDLSRFLPEELTALSRASRSRAHHLISLETVHDPSRDSALCDNGVAMVLWSGVHRKALQEALESLMADHQPVAMTRDPQPGHASPFSEPYTILVAEDFEINRAIMVHQLYSHGFRVIEAEDGEEATVQAMRGGIDLILMDIQMPGKDGLTVIRELRESPVSAGIPILGFTASADKPTHRKIIAAGANGVLTKPISGEDLIAAVRQALPQELQEPIATE